jgi:hypothetical protein
MDKLATLRKKFPTLATQVRTTMKKYQGITAEDKDDDILLRLLKKKYCLKSRDRSIRQICEVATS